MIDRMFGRDAMRALDRSGTAPGASVSRLPMLPPGWQPVTCAVLIDGSLAILATDVDLRGEWQRIEAARLASVPRDRSILNDLVAAARGRIWVVGSDGVLSEGPVFPLETWLPKIDRFVDGRWLVVDSLSRGMNARVLSPEGIVLDRFRLGIGVEHLAIGQDNRIWVGWDDQSIHANSDWKIPGQEVTKEANGVVCFDESGTPVFLPAWPDEGYAVVDPYALSVDGAGAWSCPYMHAIGYFPLVHFIPGEATRWWRNDVKGSAAIASNGDHVLLAGGWEADRLVVLALPGLGEGEQTSVLATWSMPVRDHPPGSAGLPRLLVGRVDTIHLVQDETWYRWRVRDLISS